MGQTYAPSLQLRARAELERRQRQQHSSHWAEWSQAALDAAHFINEYVIIDEPQGADVATIPFKLWPSQTDVLARLIAERLVVILKARQLGISWLCCAYALWLCLFKAGRVILIFSKGEVEAYELARRIRVMYERLPDWMRAMRAIVKRNEATLEWDNGSRVQSLAATKSGGRTFTASLVLMDEAAFMQWANEVYTALKPTIDGGGQLLIVSTANGETGLFHKLWTDALNSLNHFKTIFLSWRARPGRDDEWRAQVASEAVSSALDLQEYPETSDEAFQNTGNERFLPSMLMWDSCQEPLPALTRNEPMVLGIDAGVTNDLFAVVGVTRHPQRRQDVAVRYVRAWQPHGQPLDFDAIEREITDTLLKDRARYNVIQIAYDKYQLHQMMGRLKQYAWTREFSQQAERLMADKQLLDLVQSRRLAHDGNAELRQHIDNADRKPDAESQKLRIAKRTESLKVDLAVALSMASAECLRLNL